MSQSVVQRDPMRGAAAKFGALVAVVAAAFVVYGAYGDPASAQNQRSAVPAVLAIALIGTVIVFGLLVPAGLRAMTSRSAATKWSLGHAVASLLLIPIFWTAIPLVLGAGAVFLAVNQRRELGRSRPSGIALGLGWFVVGTSIIWTVISNVVLSR